MFETADGTRLELAPWRQRRLVAQLARARGYLPGKIPHTVMMDLHNLLRRARYISGPTRHGMTTLRTEDACCKACLLARQQRDALDVVGMVVGMVVNPVLGQADPAAGGGWLDDLLSELSQAEYPTDPSLFWPGARR